jgi:mRNA interferase MazF
MKKFDEWNKEKQKVENKERFVFAHPREIWWCSLGVNIGAEVDGKNENFERPVLIVKVYNKESMLVVPITSKLKNDSFHYELDVTEETKNKIFTKKIWIKLTQIKVISSKRLLRKVNVIPILDFEKIKTKIKESI